MSIIIGKVRKDDSIEYITVDSYAPFYDMSHKLQNFYPGEKQVDKLLSLGDLLVLGISPNGAWQGPDDEIHCRAKRRDNNERSKRLSARIADDMEELNGLGYTRVYLFKNDEWHIVYNQECEKINSLPPSFFFEKTKMKDFEVYENKRESSYSTLTQKKFDNWQQMETQAKEDKTTYFVFRNKRLVKIINPSSLTSLN